jgi:hypothetical protein
MTAVDTTTNTDVPREVFAVRCATRGCHSGERPQAGLDLLGPDLVERLRAKTSTSALCSGRAILVPGDPDSSLLFDKLYDEPVCGMRMPLLAERVNDLEFNAVRDWVLYMSEDE